MLGGEQKVRGKRPPIYPPSPTKTSLASQRKEGASQKGHRSQEVYRAKNVDGSVKNAASSFRQTRVIAKERKLLRRPGENQIEFEKGLGMRDWKPRPCSVLPARERGGGGEKGKS